MSDKVYLGQNVSDLDYDEKVYRISRVNLAVDSDHIYTSGDDTGRTLEASCPWGSQAMADSILAKVSGIDYQPYEASDALLDQAAEIGDGITLGGVYSVLAQSAISLDKQCAANISAPYNDEIDDEYPYKTPEQRKSERQLAYARSLINKTAEEIRMEVSNELDSLSSSIYVKLGSITSTVQGLGSSVSSIEQKVDSIKIDVTTKDGVSTIELTGTGITASSAAIDLSGFVTFTGLSGGTTTIDGSCIKTGTIDADRINLTGAITWGDLSSSVQNKINNAGDTVPSYIKSTYIDFSSVSSPKIVGNEIITTGHFAVTGDVGGVAGDLGYMGGANGLDAAGNITYGVALSNGSPDGLGSGDNYLIVTNGGVRMQAGTHHLTVTSNGCYADGSLIGSGAATWG